MFGQIDIKRSRLNKSCRGFLLDQNRAILSDGGADEMAFSV